MTDDALTETDIAHLRTSIELAVRAGELGNRPFGAVITGPTGEELARGINRVASTGNILSHAEIDAMEQISTPEDLIGSTVYASGEPCPMCAAALVWAGARRIVYAAAEPAFSALLPGRPRFDLSCRDVVGSTGEDIEIVGPCLGDEALVPFQAGLPT